MKILLVFKIWLAIKLERDNINVTPKQLYYLRNMDAFLPHMDSIGNIYGLRVVLK